jgi:hypothetical protein
MNALAMIHSARNQARKGRTKLHGPAEIAKSQSVRRTYFEVIQIVFTRSLMPASGQHASRGEPECSMLQARQA